MKCVWTSTSPGNPRPCQNPGTSSSCTDQATLPLIKSAESGLAARFGALDHAELVDSFGAAAEGALHLAVGVLAGEVLPLVVGPLAAGERQLDLHLSRGEVERQRDEGQP